MISSRSRRNASCLFFAACLTHMAFAAPYFTDADGKPRYLSRTICGENKMVKMSDESDAMKKMGYPIGIYKLIEEDGGIAWCTGTLISKDLFLTARHCYGECEGVSVTFGYLGETRGQETFRCKQVVEKGGDDYNQDYLIIRLEGSPGVHWGWYGMSDEELPPGQPLLMIHHPKAGSMKVSQKDCIYMGEEDGLLKHRCDTQSGSSGSAVLLPDFQTPENTRIVAVHTLGGCTDKPDSVNSGPSIRHLSEISPTIGLILFLQRLHH